MGQDAQRTLPFPAVTPIAAVQDVHRRFQALPVPHRRMCLRLLVRTTGEDEPIIHLDTITFRGRTVRRLPALQLRLLHAITTDGFDFTVPVDSVLASVYGYDDLDERPRLLRNLEQLVIRTQETIRPLKVLIKREKSTIALRPIGRFQEQPTRASA